MKPSLRKTLLPRLKATALVLALTGLPLAAGAAQLGRLVMWSTQGEPLRAEVEVYAKSQERGSLIALVASPEEFRRAGLAYKPWMSTLRVVIDRRPSTPVIRISSDEPVRDPYVGLLLELLWADGRQVREYAILLDPGERQTATAVPPPVPSSARRLPADMPYDTKPPVITGPQGTMAQATLLVPEKSTEVFTFKANKSVIWALSGADERAFSIDGSGRLSFVKPPLFKHPGRGSRRPPDNSYAVVVTATDGDGRQAAQRLRVRVMQVDDQPPVFNGPERLTVPENTTAVHVFTASEPVTWVLSGEDADKFLVDAHGRLSFRNPPDFENPVDIGDGVGNNTYAITLIATDRAGNTASRNLIVAVGDVDEVVPVITAAERVGIDENTLAVQTVSASKPVVWSVAGEDGGNFSIDANGKLAFRYAPDFEKPTDIGDFAGNNTYAVTVIATDAAGNRAEKKIIVRVNDVDEVLPVISGPSRLSIPENTAAVRAFSADKPVSWSLAGEDADKFVVDAEGRLAFRSAPDFENPTDAGDGVGNNTYVLDLVAKDATGNRANRHVVVSVTDVDEVPPVITAARMVAMPENTTAVRTVQANEPVSWSLAGPDAALFSIDAGGALAFREAPDFETPGDAAGNNRYALTLVAVDAAGNRSEQPLVVSVTDVEETPPIISGRTQLSVPENTLEMETFSAGRPVRWSLAGPDAQSFVIDDTGALRFRVEPDFENPRDGAGRNAYVLNVIAIDAVGNRSEAPVNFRVLDVDEVSPVITGDARLSLPENTTLAGRFSASKPVSWSLEGADAALFAISDEGALSFREAPDFEAPRDVAGRNHHALKLVALDAAGNRSELPVSVTVTDADEVPPAITGPTRASVPENTVAVGSFSSNEPVSWSLTGPDAALFAIDAGGVLVFRQAPDFETPLDAARNNSYVLTVAAQDAAGNRSEQPLVVSVTDVDEVLPVISGRSAVSIPENTQAVDTFSASKPVRWSLAGPDAHWLTIDDKGALSFKLAPDFETPRDAAGSNAYVLSVVAADAAGNRGTFDLVVNITDVDEVSPVITGDARLSLPENTTLAGRFSASKPVRWSLAGPDAQLFAINTEGTLAFIEAPDFEKPRDAAGKNAYALKLIATDAAGNLSEVPVSVAVTDVDEVPPVIRGERRVSIPENSTAVRVFTADEPVRWSLVGEDADKFEIDAKGQLAFRRAPDFEVPEDVGDGVGNNTYAVKLVATDEAGNRSDHPVIVVVTDVDELLPQIVGQAQVSIPENTRAVQLLQANRPVTWSLAGEDADKFTLDNGGQLSFRRVPDFENPDDVGDEPRNNTYVVHAIATDALKRTTRLDMIVTVLDVDEIPPVISGGSRVSIPENTTFVQVMSANEPVTWSVSGDDGDQFTINADGRLSFRTPPDFEKPADVGDGKHNNTYVVVVTATDAAGNRSSKPVLVSVSDVDEVPPVIKGPTRPAIPENSSLVAAYAASEKVSWSLIGPDADKFAIDAAGKLAFRVAPDFENPTDVGDGERNNTYVLTLMAVDASGNKGSFDVIVNVTDVDEVPPAFRGPSRIEVPENTTAVFAFSASKPVTWSLSGEDAALFAINAEGQLAFRKAPDFEDPKDLGDGVGNNTYALAVAATDAAGNRSELRMIVGVADVDEVPPVIRGPASIEVPENDTAVKTWTADKSVSWSLGGEDGDKFAIDDKGILSFRSAPDFENPTDVGDGKHNNTYVVVLKATDRAGNVSQQRVVVRVTDVDENAPVIKQPRGATRPWRLSIPENTTAVHVFGADKPVQWRITGPDADKFVIDPSGKLAFRASPDFETPTDVGDGLHNNTYALGLIARDAAGNQTELPIIVAVIDVDEVPPVITGAKRIEMPENTTAVQVLKADQPVKWSLSGEDADKFTIDAAGRLAFRTAPDFEKPADVGDGVGNNTYVVRAVAVDAAGNRSEWPMQVVVTDVDEVVPQINVRSKIEVPENTAAVQRVSANKPVKWSLAGPDGNQFMIDESGLLSFRRPPDFEKPTDVGDRRRNNTYLLAVIAVDQLGRKAEAPLLVRVLEVDETVPAIRMPRGTGKVFLRKVEENTTAVFPFQADVPVKWSLAGEDAEQFSIDAAGRLAFRQPPDFEKPTDIGEGAGNNTYAVTVIATHASGNRAEQQVRVQVVDVDDVPPLISGPDGSTAASIDKEVAARGTVVHAYSANEPVRWSLAGPDAEKFILDKSGLLSFRVAPLYVAPDVAGATERSNRFVVVVRATDAAGNKSEQTLNIQVVERVLGISRSIKRLAPRPGVRINPVDDSAPQKLQ